MKIRKNFETTTRVCGNFRIEDLFLLVKIIEQKTFSFWSSPKFGEKNRTKFHNIWQKIRRKILHYFGVQRNLGANIAQATRVCAPQNLGPLAGDRMRLD